MQNRFQRIVGRIGAPHAARLIACALAFLLVAAPALAEKRVALVIGNSAYTHAPALANPRNDAEGIAAALKRLNFEVLLGVDLAKQPMERLLQSFADKIDGADVALVFYAGHGLQVSGSNYLVPVDARLDKESDLAFQAISLDLVQRLMEQSQRVNIMVLDACRDNTLARNLARSMGTRSTSIGRGLGQTQAGIGTLIVYATQPGNVALDGEGRNSPFTTALLANVETPGLEIRQVFTRVRQAVIQTTKGKQVPWDSSSLTGDWFIAAAPKPGATPSAPSPAPDQETVFWQSIRDGKNIADYREYLRRWPEGTFAELAKRRIVELEKALVTTPDRPAPPRSDEPLRIGQVFRDCTDCPEMVVIPAGSFMMGWKGDQHRVTIASTFALGKYSLTFAEYDVCVAAGGCTRKPNDQGWGRSTRPVIDVSWDDAKAYAAWLSKRTGKTYHLPSQAESEYAARAGTTTAYSWGDEIGRNRANCRGCGSRWDGRQTSPVGSFAPNAFGLHDMHGNVWEWVEDCWNASYAGAPSDGRAWLSGDCKFRILRGGSWHDEPSYLPAAHRRGATSRYQDSNIGFRLARTLD